MDYAEIISNLDTDSVIHLMTELGADRYDDRGDFVIFPTICHNLESSEASMKLYFYKKNKMFVCYTECGSMSIFKFLRTYYEERQIEYDWYQDIYEVVCNCSSFKQKEGFIKPVYKSLKERYSVVRKEVQLPEYSPNVLDCFIKYYPPEWLNDGISRFAMDKFNISYSISQNKIIIPHYDINNRLVGIRGRALNESEIAYAKYAPVKIEDIVYKHKLSLNLYGLNHNWKNIKELGICYIAESEKAVLQSELFGEKNCTVAICGSSLNIYQIKLLMQHCQPKEIVLCLDKEELPGEDKYFYKLWDMCSKYKLYTNMSFIYDREN